MMSIKHTLERRNEKVERLRHIPLFAACTDAELALVARNVDEQHAGAGQVLTRQGEVGREFFVIVEGTAEVRIDDAPVARLGPGAFAGELALLDRRCRTATVVAETPLVTMVSGTTRVRRAARRSAEHDPQADGRARRPAPRGRPHRRLIATARCSPTDPASGSPPRSPSLAAPPRSTSGR